MKEETKIFMSKIMIMLEKQLSDIDQDYNTEGISERERKGIEIEKKEILSEYLKAKKCFNWLDNLR